MRGRVNGWFRGALGWLRTAGWNVLQGLWNGMRAVWGKVTSWVSGLAGWIKGHKGPLGFDRKLLEPAGRALMEGLHAGLLTGALGPLGFVTGLAGTIGGLITKGLGSIFGGGGGYAAGGGVARWAGLVQTVLKMLHQPLSWTGLVLRRINQESGGNPKAINLWDINAQRGDPSRGLMQTIGATFAAYAGPFLSRGIYDPLANIYAGLNYAIHRYGSLAALGRPGGYARGGLITEPIAGLGLRTGRPYTFGERGEETVIPGRAAPAAGVREIAALGGKLDRLIRIMERNAADTAAGIGAALDGAAGRAAHRAAYSVR
jgi:SLT domain-containing protein